MINSLRKSVIVLTSNGLLGSLPCKNARFLGALKLFDRMPIRAIKSFNTLVDGCSQTGIISEDLNSCKRSETIGFEVDKFGYAGALSVCAQKQDLRNGRIIHGLVVVSGLAPRVFLTNSLIDMYAQCGRIDWVRLLFDHAVELDDVSWNLLLSAYVRIGWLEVAADILVWMHRHRVKLNSHALDGILKVTGLRFEDLEEETRKLLYGCVIKVGLDLDFLVGSSMSYVFASDGGLDDAVEVFDRVFNASLIVFNVMIRGLSQLGTETCTEVQLAALRLYVEMIRRRMRPSKLTIKSVLETCIPKKEFKFGDQVHAYIIKNNLEAHDLIGSALITMYSNSDLVEESLRCFKYIPRQDIGTWESMIQGFVRNGYLESAMTLLRNLLMLGRTPGQNIISSLLVGSGNLGSIRSGEQMHGYAIKGGHDQLTVCVNSQIFFYTNIGDVDASIKIFQETTVADLIPWSLMILNHALHGQARDALDLFDKMKEFKLLPKHFTFFAVLTACSRGGLIFEGFR